MQVWNALHAARCKYRTQKSRQKSPSRHHRTTLSGHIFATKAYIDNRKKNLLSSNTSSTCPHNMVNFGPLTADRFGSLGHSPKISTGFASWQRYCTASSSGRQPNFAALNKGRHLCSAGRPSRWALAHISSCTCFKCWNHGVASSDNFSVLCSLCSSCDYFLLDLLNLLEVLQMPLNMLNAQHRYSVDDLFA